jgi:hypothetical protein
MMVANQFIAGFRHLAITLAPNMAQELLLPLLSKGPFDKFRTVAEGHGK